MSKKLLALLTTIILVVFLSTSAFAMETPISDSAMSGEVNLSEEANVENNLNNATLVNSSKLSATGETVSISDQRAGIQRAGQVVDTGIGAFTGTLTDTNTWDYYIFSSNTAFSSISKIVTSNSNYTMTLGVVDYSTGVINLTNYVTPANQLFRVNFDQPGTYAWVIQSSNATYGDDYQLNYNMSLSKSTNLIYVTDDLQKLYAITNQKLTINGQVKNIDYKYDSEWEVPPVGAGELHWNKIHVWMENANVQAIHVGGCKYYASAQLYNYPNSIVLAVQPGGLFTHKFSQNPPYYNWYNKDAAGIETPRAINNEDISNRGGQYLIYDLNTDRVVEFASGLTKPWSNLGDKHDLSIY